MCVSCYSPNSFVYNVNRSPSYELTYLWFIQATCICAFGTPAIDTFFYAGAFNVSAHFQIIQRHADRIRYGTNGGYISWLQLRELRAYHQRTIDLAQYLTQTYQPILLVHFAVSSVQICAIAYQLTLVNNV